VILVNATNILAIQRRRLKGIYRGWWIVAIGHYTQAVIQGGGGWIFGALVIAMQTDLGWSQKAVVGALTMNRLLGGLLSAPLGPVVDRHGSRVLMTVSAVLAGVAMIIVGLADSVFWFYAAWALFGIASPGVNLLGPRVTIANWFTRKRPAALVLFTLGSATAGIVLVPAAAWITMNYSWRAVWVILGLMAIAIAPFCWIAIRRSPEDVGLLPDGDDPSTRVDGEGRAVAPVIDPPWTVREVLHSRSFWLLTIGFLLVSMPSGTIFINISGFAQSRGFSVATGATIVSVYGFGVLAGRPVWGFFLTRMGTHRTMYLYAALYGSAIFAFTLRSGLIGMYLATLWLGMAIAAGTVLHQQVLPDYYGRRIVGSLTGFSQLPNTAIGGSTPLLTAAVFDRTGDYAPAFLFFAVACFVAAVAFFLAAKPVHPSDRTDVAALPPDSVPERIRA
jgi:sugar phosphate permease